jgi:ketosteroid isomerase-like protein
MKKIFFITAAQTILVLLLFFNCQAQKRTNINLEEAKKAITASNEMYFQAFAKGDPSLFISLYTTDCWIMQPNAPTLCGVDAPLDFFKTAYNKFGIRNGKFITIDIFGDGNGFVTEEGFWQTFDANNRLLDNGKFLVLWKKTAGGWKIFRDSFSSDRDK